MGRWPGRGFVREAGILAGAGFLVKILGGLLRIPLTRLMGPEGMGLYQLAYAAFGLAVTLFVSGFPLALSSVVAERLARRQSPQPAFRWLLVFMLLVGGAGALALYLGAGLLTELAYGEPRAAGAVRGIAPALLLVALMSVFRGYFQGHQRMGPTALSQILEQLVRVVGALVMVSVLLPVGLEHGARGAATGTTLGAAAGLAFLVVVFRNREEPVRRPSIPATRERVAARLVGMAVPVSLGALLLPALDAMNAVLIPSRLQSVGVESGLATALYGKLAGVALPMMGLSAVVSISLAASLVPEVTAASTAGDGERVHRDSATALSLALLMSIPAAVGLWVLAAPIGSTVFGLAAVGPLLRIVAPGCVFLALQQTSTGLLLGLRRPSAPLLSLLVGLSVNGCLLWTLTPSMGISGAALAMPLALAAACVANLSMLRRAGGRGGIAAGLLRPLVAAAGMAAAVGVCVPVLQGLLGEVAGLAAAVLTGAAVYLLLLAVLGSLRRA